MMSAGEADAFPSDHLIEMLTGSQFPKESPPPGPTDAEIHHRPLHVIVNRTAFPPH